MAEQNMCRMTQLRLRYGISQADLANAAGVSRQLISLIELDTASQSKGHEALIRRAFSAVIAQKDTENLFYQQHFHDAQFVSGW